MRCLKKREGEFIPLLAFGDGGGEVDRRRPQAAKAREYDDEGLLASLVLCILLSFNDDALI